MDIKKLNRVAIVGPGLLGGSAGLALRACGFAGVRVGVGRRASSLRRALACGAVDEVTRDVAGGVAEADLVLVCTPIGQIEPLLRVMAPALPEGVWITDVASTKVEVVRAASRILPRHARFVGSHPMAGSEKTGVEFARADLFERSLCLVTPKPGAPAANVRGIRSFWAALGARTTVLSPAKHDTLLARVSHLPHAVAAALVRLAIKDQAIDCAGPGFADTTRIASGDPGLWTDIFRTNRAAMLRSIDLLIAELRRFRGSLERDDAAALYRWLDESRDARDAWIDRRYKKKDLPP